MKTPQEKVARAIHETIKKVNRKRTKASESTINSAGKGKRNWLCCTRRRKKKERKKKKKKEKLRGD